MEADDLADLPLDRMQRIEASHRLLKHHGHGCPAHGAQFVVGHLEHVAAAKQNLAGRIAGGGLRQEAHDRLGGHSLARAGLPDQRQRAALLQPEGDAVDDGPALAPLREGDRELAHVEERVGLAHENVFLGSKASRTASPMKMRSDSISAVTAKAESPIHGADRLDLPCSRSSPSEGEPGGIPRPRKSSEVSVLIEELTMNGRKVSVATIAFGSTCLTMILALERPSARAALTYSKLRARRNSALTK